jgi:hypothetical protein
VQPGHAGASLVCSTACRGLAGQDVEGMLRQQSAEPANVRCQFSANAGMLHTIGLPFAHALYRERILGGRVHLVEHVSARVATSDDLNHFPSSHCRYGSCGMPVQCLGTCAGLQTGDANSECTADHNPGLDWKLLAGCSICPAAVLWCLMNTCGGRVGTERCGLVVASRWEACRVGSPVFASPCTQGCRTPRNCNQPHTLVAGNMHMS